MIVGSILLAFGLQAWWEGRQEERRASELVSALLLDFETTRTRLETSIAWSDSLIARSAAFLRAAQSTEPVPLDSLRFLAGGSFRAIPFEPALSAYRAAVATGDLQLIQNPTLVEAFADFDQGLDYFGEHSRVSADLYYLGATWDLRRELGTLRVLEDDPQNLPAPFRTSEAEYRALVRRPTVTATVETVLTANRNLVSGLRAADAAALMVIEELRHQVPK